MLSSQNTIRVRKLVEQAYRAKFGKDPANVFFNTNQWWATSEDLNEAGLPRMFSVVDAEPGIDDTGLDLEAV